MSHVYDCMYGFGTCWNCTADGMLDNLGAADVGNNILIRMHVVFYPEECENNILTRMHVVFDTEE